MPNWYYDLTELKATPSVVGGMEYSTEQRYRKEGARFIFNVGTRMGLRNDTLATGVVYFHRFYMFHSFTTFPRFVTACCCLFLAGKVEETPKKCKDIIKTARIHLTAQQFSQFGDDPKEEVMTLERILLQTIKFDLQVDHPYKYLLKYAKSLKGDKEKLQEMVQMAWTFINDSLCTTLCLQWEPEIIGIALMYLAGKLTKFEIIDWDGRTPKHKYWWDMFVENLNVDFLEDICHQFLDFYGFQGPATPQDSSTNSSPAKRPKKSHSPSQKDSVESAKSFGKSNSKSRTCIKDAQISNSDDLPPGASLPPLSDDVPNNQKALIKTLPKQNSLATSDAENETSAVSKTVIPTTVSITNVHSSLIQNVPASDILHSQNYPQSVTQTHCFDQTQPAAYEGQQIPTVTVAQVVSHMLVPPPPPPPLFNNQDVKVYSQQCKGSEKVGKQHSSQYFTSGTSPFNGQFPNFQQPPSQFYQRHNHQEHYYNNSHHAANPQSTYMPPAHCSVVSSLPVRQTLPPPQHPPPLISLSHLISLPPPPVRPPLPHQPSRVHIQYCASGHSSTMPFPLHEKQISNNMFALPGKSINPGGIYRYGSNIQSAQHHFHNSVDLPPVHKF